MSTIDMMSERGRWHGRDAQYWAGRWAQLRSIVPSFTLADYTAGNDLPANPHLRTVIREPRTAFEQPVPVGTVSNTYSLVQHAELVNLCMEGLESAGVDLDELRCEMGLTGLGEWMNFRIYLPERFRLPTTIDGTDGLDLRLECFNSVDGSSKLVILFGWFRFVCSNGLIIGDSVAEIRDIHNRHLSLKQVPDIVVNGLSAAKKDGERIHKWASTIIAPNAWAEWVDGPVTAAWGKLAACRAFHICGSGQDVEVDSFSPGTASTKSVSSSRPVPGSPSPSTTVFHASQALSWIASKRNDPEERVAWQRQIPELVGRLPVTGDSKGQRKATHDDAPKRVAERLPDVAEAAASASPDTGSDQIATAALLGKENAQLILEILDAYFEDEREISFADAVRKFQGDYGDGARQFDRFVEDAWKWFTQEDQSVASVLGDANANLPAHGGDRSGQTHQPGQDGPLAGGTTGKEILGTPPTDLGAGTQSAGIAGAGSGDSQREPPSDVRGGPDAGAGSDTTGDGAGGILPRSALSTSGNALGNEVEDLLRPHGHERSR